MRHTPNVFNSILCAHLRGSAQDHEEAKITEKLRNDLSLESHSTKAAGMKEVIILSHVQST